MDPEAGSRDLSSVRKTKIPDGIVLSPEVKGSRSSTSQRRLLLMPKSVNDALNAKVQCRETPSQPCGKV